MGDWDLDHPRPSPPGSEPPPASSTPAYPITPGFRAAVNALYQKYYRRDATEAELASHVGNPGGVDAIEDLLKASLPPTPPVPPVPPVPPTPHPGIYDAPLTKPFGEQFAGPARGPLFTPPGYTTPPPFHAPSAEEALNDPGYAFRKQQGEQSLQNWAAARGTLNDSGTAKALSDYGANAASQEYANVWDRAYNTYNTNVQTQFTDPYARLYQGATDAFAASEHRGDTNYLNSWNEFLNRQNQYNSWQDRTWNKTFDWARA